MLLPSVAAVAAIAFSGLFTPPSQATYEDELENVKSLIRNGDGGGALARAEELLRAEPERAGAYFVVGDLYRRAWRPREALDVFEQGLSRTKASAADLHREMAVTLAELRLWEPAIEHMERALELSPNHPASVFTKAMLLSQKGTRGEALRLYQTLLEADPDNAELHFRVGEIQESIQRLDEAETSYRSALTLLSAHQGARFRLGQMLLASGRAREAERELAKAVQLSVDHAPSHHELAKALEALERVPKAKHHYQRALELDPGFAPAHLSYGNFALRLGDAEAGRHHLEEFQGLSSIADRSASLIDEVDFDPENEAAKETLVDYLLETGQFPLATRLVQRFQVTASDDERHALLLVRVYDAWGRREDAARTLDEAAARYPDSERVKAELARRAP